jgi:phenylacetate-CoA ligase
LIVSGEMANDKMTLHCETASTGAQLTEELIQTIREVTKLRGEVSFVGLQTLPNDGKVIDDQRKYD